MMILDISEYLLNGLLFLMVVHYVMFLINRYLKPYEKYAATYRTLSIMRKE